MEYLPGKRVVCHADLVVEAEEMATEGRVEIPGLGLELLKVLSQSDILAVQRDIDHCNSCACIGRRLQHVNACQGSRAGDKPGLQTKRRQDRAL